MKLLTTLSAIGVTMCLPLFSLMYNCSLQLNFLCLHQEMDHVDH